MNLISKPAEKLVGEASLPGDKSISHRAALLAALAEGESRIDNFLRAGVTQVMLDSLAMAGVELRWDGDSLIVRGVGERGFSRSGTPLFCGNSATTFRLLAGVLSSQPAWKKDSNEEWILDGSAQLRKRPMGRIIEPLREMGGEIRGMEAENCAPLGITPTRLHGIAYDMPVASAQVKSAILLAGLHADSPTTVVEPTPSRDHTERFFLFLKIPVMSIGNRVTVHPIQKPWPAFPLSVPGDFSSAAFVIVAATILSGSDILLRNVGLNPRRTGLMEVLLRMGASIEVLQRREVAGEPIGDLRIRSSELCGTQVKGAEVVDMIDEFPIFAVAAALAKGETIVSQAEELRHKESDRISRLTGELRKLGVQIKESADGFSIIGPTSLEAAGVESFGDHRLAMALSIAGMSAKGNTRVNGAECIQESFPGFIAAFNSLGARLE